MVTCWDIVCDEFADVFGEPPSVPEREVTHRIILSDPDLPPPKPRQYRMSEAELRKVRTQLEEYLEKGWVRPSSSSWGAPVLFARKKDSTLRMCIDFRSLN